MSVNTRRKRLVYFAWLAVGEAYVLVFSRDRRTSVKISHDTITRFGVECV